MIQKKIPYFIIFHILLSYICLGSDYMDEFINDIEEYLDMLNIEIAEIEKIGASLLSVGYALFYLGADLDIQEVINDDNSFTQADDVTLFGQKMIFIGYIILFIVNRRRIDEKILINKYEDENIELWPYILITKAYLISVFANYLRVVGFSYISLTKRSDN